MRMHLYSILVSRVNQSPVLMPVCRNCIEGYPCRGEVFGVKCKGASDTPGLLAAINVFRRQPQVMREMLYKS